MAYTAKDAIQTFDRYLQNININKVEIEGTKKRGYYVTTSSNDSFVYFIYPLVHKQDGTKNYFDTRDSGAAERAVAWEYAIEHNCRYYCFGVNEQVDKYKNFIFSLECHEKYIEQLSGTEKGNRIDNGPGNQIIIPNDFIPSKKFERIQNKLGVYISVIRIDFLPDYIEFYDNRPYLNLNPAMQPIHDNGIDNYPISFNTNIKCSLSRNRIVFGAPGTGKSFLVNDELKNLLKEFSVDENNYERVTFHPDYSYANFVGTYKPVMVENDSCCDMDDDEKNVIKVLHDKDKSAQEQYDILKSNPSIGNSVVPILVSLCNEGAFQTSSSDGQNADYRTQINHGVSLRKYVQLKTSEPKSSEISYEYVPGPFMRMYVKALRNAQNVANGTEKPRPFLLIIEEINRANVAAVFGDVFQLLDRKNNVSEYPIQASEDIKKYLAKELGGCPNHYAKIRIPDNLFIWATMNSADQGVFPMDTAFKRRWDFTYLGIDDNDKEIQGKYVQIGSEKQWVIEWNTLRQAINKFLADEKINEDKQLGPYFIAKDIVVPANGGNVIDRDLFNDVFKHKVLMYLFDDAAKQKRSKLFEGIPTESSRYSKICEAFEKKGIEIFHSSIREMVTTLDRLPNEKDPELVRGVDDIKYKDDLENSEG